MVFQSEHLIKLPWTFIKKWVFWVYIFETLSIHLFVLLYETTLDNLFWSDNSHSIDNSLPYKNTQLDKSFNHLLQFLRIFSTFVTDFFDCYISKSIPFISTIDITSDLVNHTSTFDCLYLHHIFFDNNEAV